jgi:hypothetical protein
MIKSHYNMAVPSFLADPSLEVHSYTPNSMVFVPTLTRRL